MNRLKLFLLNAFWVLVTGAIATLFATNMSVRWSTLQAATDLNQILLQIEFVALMLIAFTSLAFAGLILKRQIFDWVTSFILLLVLTTGMPLTIDYAKIVWAEPVWRGLGLGLTIVREIILIGTLALFPNGNFMPRGLRGVFALLGLAFVSIPFIPLSRELNRIAFDGVRYTLYLCAIFSQVYRYRRTPNGLQRQQVKWVLIAITVSMLGRVIIPTLELLYHYDITLVSNTPSRLLLATFPDVFLIVAFGIAALRYRLWDINFFINRALVYSALTAILGILITILITLTNNYLKQILGSQPTLVVILSALPVAASFNPLRIRLQAFVDRYFKPEQVDFNKTFLEFKSEVRTLFTPSELMDILTRRVTAQLNISHSAVFAAHADSFVQVMPPRPRESALALPLTVKRQNQIAQGKIVIPDEDELPFSMLVPLTSPHHGAPRLIGIMALGARSNEQGYPTQVQEALQKLGEEAGTAIYIAQLHEQRKVISRQ